MGGPGLGEVDAKRTKESVISRALGSLRFSDTSNLPSSAGIFVPFPATNSYGA